MSVSDIANRLVELCKEGKFEACYPELFSPNLVSIEAQGEPREFVGMEAVLGKAEWWNATYEVLGAEVDGPWVNEPYFAVKFVMDTKDRKTGELNHMEEVAIYTVEDGKIVSERFFY
jgi:hypothetical protein